MSRPRDGEPAAPPPRISVVVPTFNAERHLASCLDSVVAQSWPDLEVIVADAGSTDATLGIVAGFAGRHPFVHCDSRRDRGIYDAMNRGVALASGRWLHFMGADDQLASNTVFEAMARGFDHGVQLVYGDVFVEGTGRTTGGPFDRERLFNENICHQAILYRRDLFEKLGPYDLQYRLYADWEFNLRCFALPCVAAHVPVTVCRYGTQGSSAGTADRVFLEKRLELISALYGASFWSDLFRSCRYGFHDEASRSRTQGRPLRAARFFALYAYHGLRSRLARMRGASARA
jgi:hypothetical protein